MPSPLRPLAKAIRDGFFRGVGDGLEQMWSHVLKELLSGKLARLASDLGRPRREPPDGTRGAAEKATSKGRYGTTQMRLSASAVVFRVQLTYRDGVFAARP
jgi:hypothetical protein